MSASAVNVQTTSTPEPNEPDHADELRRRQLALMGRYRDQPEAAAISDIALTEARHAIEDGPLDPLYSEVTMGHTEGAMASLRIAVHAAVGGRSDDVVPGDLLCGALASCTDSTLRGRRECSRGLALRAAGRGRGRCRRTRCSARGPRRPHEIPVLSRTGETAGRPRNRRAEGSRGCSRPPSNPAW